MHLITEQNFDDVHVITEESDSGEKNLYIEGIFLQANIKNRNGRIYEDSILKPVLEKYDDEYVKKGRAIGECLHPESVQINLDRVSHRITELNWNKNDVVGKAIIMKTPMGGLVRGLLEGGTILGVSSRGTGSLEERNGAKYVKDDFNLVTVDIVSDPSAPSAFVNGILEGVEILYDKNGNLIEKNIEIVEKKIVNDTKRMKKKKPSMVSESTRLRDLERFLQRLT